MADYFTSDHFKLLNRWKRQARDDSNPEQNRAYEELVKAYRITERWATAVRDQLFTDGTIELRKRPTNQANNFFDYNWAKIYPYRGAPKQLAYTVGIGAGEGFVVKIDTVGLNDWDKTRKQYEELRVEYSDQSPIVAMLPMDEGLAMDLPSLVEWSIQAIQKFQMTYDEVASKLGLVGAEQDILKHFQGHKDFVQRQPAWSEEVTSLFIRLANVVHELGLDWYFTDATNSQLRFGRKSKSSQRGSPVGWLYLKRTGIGISMEAFGAFQAVEATDINASIIETIEKAAKEGKGAWPEKLIAVPKRGGYWPDDYEVEDEESVPPSDIPDPRNIIYYGPPGTGKTYAVEELLKREYTQASESLSAEEWRQQIIAEHIAPLTWWEGAAAALYDLGGKAKVGELFEHPFIQAIIKAKSRNKNVRQTLWGTLQHHANEDSSTVNIKLRLAPAVFDKTAESVWHFWGDWQEACAELVAIVDRIKQGPQTESATIERFSFVTFHQSYGYEEFVEGLRPVLSDEAEGLSYEIRKGAFLRLCEKARNDPSHRYAMVIDEINRGNISKIFGELITLIELDKRDPLNGMPPRIEVKLAYSSDVPFSVPANVDIIGTMNTADRSLALVDTALRRRFDFVPCLPDTSEEEGAPLNGLVVTSGDKSIDIRLMLYRMNERIEALYDRDHTIGHAYFTSLHLITDAEGRFTALSQIFRNRIIPLLEEYFFEDWQKIRLVLADNQKPDESCFITVQEDQDSKLADLFGTDHDLDTFATNKHYSLNENAFNNPGAYLGIYTKPTS